MKTKTLEVIYKYKKFKKSEIYLKKRSKNTIYFRFFQRKKPLQSTPFPNPRGVAQALQRRRTEILVSNIG